MRPSESMNGASAATGIAVPPPLADIMPRLDEERSRDGTVADVERIETLNAEDFALDLSKAALSTMKRNLFWALAYNVVALPVAAGALSSFGLVMSPVIASAAMSLSSVSVVLSSLLLGRKVSS